MTGGRVSSPHIVVFSHADVLYGVKSEPHTGFANRARMESISAFSRVVTVTAALHPSFGDCLGSPLICRSARGRAIHRVSPKRRRQAEPVADREAY